MGTPVTQDGAWQVGLTFCTSANIIRPNDANAYAAGDVISNSTTAAASLICVFPNCAKSNGLGGILQGALLVDSVAAATKPDTELYLFTRPPVMQADNGAWGPSDAEVLYSSGVVAFPTGSFKTMGANGMVDVYPIGRPYACDPNDTNLYGVLVARNAYTPAALENFKITLCLLRD